MKKKILCMFIGLTLMAPLVFSDGVDFSAQVSPVGFMNFNVWTKYDKDTIAKASETVKKLFKDYNKFFHDGYNMYTLGVDFRISGAYLTLNVGLPRKISIDDIKDFGGTLNNNSFIFNGQLGYGATFFKESPVNLFVGGGIGFDIIRTTRDIPATALALAEWQEERLIALLGLGLNVGVSFYFLPHVGIFAGVTDNLSFIQVSNQQYYTKAGALFYLQNGVKDIKKMTSGLLANNVTARLGIAFKL
ncbi:hypothetical protein DWB79_09570 [Treponema medium]|uniref:Outer membrane protein beta-barrel domain-containing protein n=2 Tax=Treponema medium TaxID=58231 RepID=A0AA87NTM2_TREMD|nr:DUF2715 domain-containing protein [Treponema medium]EPF28196.1 hypothetical protein HMPREF9195_01888 [Treponema medium ATCC 700293]QSH97991.1 hypothetical protein DWB79_09570 [Treponema medium]